MLEDIKTRQIKKPFEPFAIRLADGRQLPVLQPEHVWLPVPGVLLYHDRKSGGSESVNPAAIQGVEKLDVKRTERRRRRG